MKKVIMLFLIACVFFISNENAVLYAEEQQIQEEIIYNILIDRYNNGDHSIDYNVDVNDPYAYHGGDFQGIITRLNELQELGITTLSLSPIMANAEKGYHGYWIEDFFQVEEQFGSMEDFQLLVEEAHKRNMKVVIEYVTQFIAPSNPIVQDSEKADWIVDQELSEPKWINDTVKLNLQNEAVQQYLFDVADFWMNETEIDGFKIQAVDQMPVSFLQALTEHIKSINPNFYLIGDILEADKNSQEILVSTGIQMIENTALNQTIRDTFLKEDNEVSDIYEVWEGSGNQLPILYLDDMYSKRFTQEFSENGRNSLTAWKLALTYMYTTPGVPMIFQGSEIPMYGEDAVAAQSLVQFNSGDSDLQEFFHKISSLRTQFPALQYGDFELIDSSNAMSVFRRSYEGDTLYIAINNSSTSQDITVSGIEPGMQLRGYLEDNLVRANDNGDYRIGLPRESVEVFHLQPDKGLNWGFISFVCGILLLFVVGVIYLSRKQKQREAEE
ncbi:alpha-amylase family glycosyl hydrolase [Oceanobacillus sp. Castelsardo]|uniref:alpha-amylase family glycosyl hydrolase n=1 Tax=Oceanobacillus sp. Castelsardo TaxID=1851204 RepID=UPI000838C342|nr:alpha-amylase family glycosyl hydrolase [Oceanobacillus sp. Castelsardo]